MHLRITVLVLLVTCIQFPLLSQTSLSSLGFSSLPGADVERTRTFTKESLYGYIDGGAELYLEFGFDTLVVTELVCNNRDMEVEIYRMKDDEAAFGIFSVSRFRCNGGPKLTKHLCRSAYQVQFCKGPFYVSIVNDSGTEAEQKCANELSSYLLARISESSFEPSRFFTEGVDEETMRSAVLVRGPLGIFNGIPAFSEIIGELTGYSAMIIKKDGKTIASVLFDDAKEATRFISKGVTALPIDTTVYSGGPAVSVVAPQHIVITLE